MQMDAIVFLDIEASGLGADSFPIEIGWAYLDGQSDGFLIRPASDWSHWDMCAQAMHGISWNDLHCSGIDTWTAAKRLNAEFSGGRRLCVVSDAASNDLYWLDRLFEDTPYERQFDLIDIAYAALITSQELIPLDDGEKGSITVHRAQPDALALRNQWIEASNKNRRY